MDKPIPEAMVDALYDELFRVGRYLHAPVPIDPKEIIRRHLTAAQQQGQAPPPSAPVVDEAMTRRIMADFRANDPGDVWPPRTRPAPRALPPLPRQ